MFLFVLIDSISRVHILFNVRMNMPGTFETCFRFILGFIFFITVSWIIVAITHGNFAFKYFPYVFNLVFHT